MEGQAEAASEGDSDTRRGSPAVATAPAPPRTAAAPVDVLPPRAEEERSLLHSAPVQHVSSSTWYAMDVQGSDDGRPSPRKPLGFVTAGLPRSSDPLLRHSALQAGTLPGGITARERLYMVTLFTATASLLYADQNLMAPNLSSIAADFNFDDKQRDRMLGGFIAAAFYMVGAPAALLFGWLSDKVSRKRLLFAAVMLGEGPCILTIFVHHYWELLILRLLTGIALGGALPVVFSLLGDLYDPSRRAGVSSIVQLSTGIGLAMGQGIAGFVGPALGWRWPFVIVSLPAIAVSFLMLFTCREPLRGGTEAALQEQFQEHPEGFVYREVMTWRKLGHLLVIPTNALVITQGLFGCLPWGMILVFLNDFLAQNKGLSVQQSTFVLLVLGVGGGIGVVGGGWLGQWLYNRWKWSMSLFIGSATVVGTLPLAYLVNADVAAHPPLTLFMALMAGLLSGTVGPNMRAMILNVNEPETRGTALALQTMLDDLGKGLGPVFVAAFIEKLGRVGAFNISTAGWIPCGLLLLGTSVSLARDEKAMQQRLRHVLGSYSYTFSSSTLLSDSEQQRASGQPAEHCTRVAGTGDSSSSHRLSAPDVRGGTSMQHRPGAKAP